MLKVWELLRYRPSVFGECLRHLFFEQDEGYGCYSTFDVRDGVKSLPDEPVYFEDEDDEPIYIYKCFEAEVEGLGVVKMAYYWDGDGTLEFRLPDGKELINSDCKKDYTWEFI